MAEIIQVEVSSESGSILPELQWHEEIVLTKQQLQLTRNGKQQISQVNAGTWVYETEGQQVAALFTQLEKADCFSMERIEPEDPPDGGDTVSYTLTYQDGKSCSLYFEPGATYENGDLIVKPLQSFLSAFPFSPEALSRYQD